MRLSHLVVFLELLIERVDVGHAAVTAAVARFGLVFAAALPRGMGHDRRGIKHDDNDQPAQKLDGMLLTMNAATSTAGMPPSASPTTTLRSI